MHYSPCRRLLVAATLAVLLLLLSSTSGAEDASAPGPPASPQQPPPADAATPLERSVEPFYRLTEQFLDLIQPVEKSAVMAQALSVFVSGDKSSISVYASNWRQTSQRFALSMLGYLILVIIGLLFIIVLPFTGCVVFCCRCCCGKCGGRVRPMERTGSKCRRVVYGALLTLLATLMLCGLVLAFISNQLVHNAMDHSRQEFAPRRMAYGLSGAAAQLRSIPARARNRSARVISAAVARISPAVRASLVAMRASLLAESGVTRLLVGEASAALNDASESRRLSGLLEDGWPAAQNAHKHLNSSLADLRNAIGGGSDGCSGLDGCDWLRDNAGSLYPGWEDPSSAKSSCSDIYPAGQLNAPELAANGTLARWLGGSSPPPDFFPDVAYKAIERELEAAKTELNSSAELDRIWSSAERLANATARRVDLLVSGVNSMVINPTSNAEQSLASVITAFDLYRYYFYIGLACLALLIVAFLYLGLAFGFCGEPPYEDSRCCNRGVGANLLLAGTGFAFLFGWLIMIFVMTFFVTGAVMDTELCRHLTGRSGPLGYRVLDDTANELLLRFASSDYSHYTVRPFGGLLGECAHAASAGRRANLAAALNITEVVRTSDLQERTDWLINEAAETLTRNWRDVARDGLASSDQLAGNVTALQVAGDAAKKKLLGEKCSGAVAKPVLRGDLSMRDLKNAIRRVADAAASSASGATAAPSDRSAASLWRALADRFNDSMALSIDKQRGVARQLVARLEGVAVVANGILKTRLADARTKAAENSTVFNASLAVARLNLTNALAGVLSNAVAEVLNSAADCAAIGAHLSQAVDAPCVQILRPFNGYWAGLGVFLICLLPSLVLACKLANLYRKTAKYEKDYQEPDYMAYQGFYPSDTVPLEGRSSIARQPPA